VRGSLLLITHHLLLHPSKFERDASPDLKSGYEMAPDGRRPSSQQADQLPIFEMIEPALGQAALLANDGQVVKGKAAASFRWNLVIEIKCRHFDRPATVMTMMSAEVARNEIAKIAEPIIQTLSGSLGLPKVPLIKLVCPLPKNREVLARQHRRYPLLCKESPSSPQRHKEHKGKKQKGQGQFFVFFVPLW
jgi:hypothetical protein